MENEYIYLANTLFNGIEKRKGKKINSHTYTIKYNDGYERNKRKVTKYLYIGDSLEEVKDWLTEQINTEINKCNERLKTLVYERNLIDFYKEESFNK